MIVLRLKYSKSLRDIRWIDVLLPGCILLWLLSFPFPAFAQLELRNKVVKYTTGKGLPLKVINCMTQDKQGFMWFAADDGIARFDGYTFKVFTNDPNDPHSLSHNYIFNIFTDSQGRVWTSSREGLNQFDPLTERFIHYKHDPANTNSLVGDDVSNIRESITGGLWVSSWEAGFTYYDVKQNKFIQYSQRNLPGLSSHKVVCTYEDRENMLWVGSLSGGLDVFQVKNGIISKQIERLSRKDIPALRNVRCMAPDHAGNVWIGTNDGLIFFNRKQNTFQLIDKQTSILKGMVIRSLLEDSNHNLWIGAEGNGLYKISLKDIDSVVTPHFIAESVPGKDAYSIYRLSIHNIYEDRDKNIWIGTNGDGAQMISSIQEKFMRLEVKTGEAARIHWRFWGMCTDEDGNLWLGTDGNGIYKYTQQGKLLKQYRADGKKGSLTDNAILYAYRDRDNILWFGTYAQGLFRYDKKTETFTNYKHDPNDPESLGINDVRVIFEDSKRNLWIGTNWGGLNLLDRSTGKFTRYTINNSSISSGDIRTIIEDNKGGLWLGCSKGGVNYFDRDKKTFRQYFADKGSKNDISGNMIYALLFDKRGKLWIGTEGAGLLTYDSAQQKLQWVKEHDGFYSSTVFAMQQDNEGNIWLSTNTGISKWDVREKVFRNYDSSDGLQSGQFNSCSFLYDKKSNLMGFAGTEGVTLFYPDQIKPNLQKPDVVITGFELFNKDVPIDSVHDEDAILHQAINHTREITLQYNESVFTLEFAALSYTLPEKNQYAYKMENFDHDWNYVGSGRSATYTNLDPGTYTFRVKASNNDGVWNEDGVSLVIHIIPPWWKTWWFRTLAVLSLIGIAWAYSRLRIKAINEQKNLLEISVHEKTRQLQQVNDELLLREEEIKAQNEDLSLQNEELFSRQEEIATQRDLLTEQNQRLEDAWKTIETQNKEILLHNKTLDQEVKERTQKLVEYNQQLEQFAFIAAHNLRAPVARILGLGQVLDLAKDNLDEERLIVSKLISTTVELDKVVRDVSTILEIKKSNTPIIKKVDLTEELSNIKANLESEITETNTEIREDFSRANVIYTAKAYLDSILINLIHNAIKYRDLNRKPAIHIKTEVADGYVCLLISDNGLGIDLALHQNNIFNLYKRFHTHVDGKGMGLYLVKTQVTALGGKIEVESKVNVGTTFKVFLRNVDENEKIQNEIMS
jgi:ligand-binding sensor domain-containing protein/signal transduction histidine kinase